MPTDPYLFFGDVSGNKELFYALFQRVNYRRESRSNITIIKVYM